MRSRPTLAVVFLTTWLTAAAASADVRGPTVYKMQNRWIQQKYLYVDGDRVQTGPADGDGVRWTLEPAGSAYPIRNVDSGKYLRLDDDSDLLTTTADRPADDRGRWFVEPVDIYVTIRNAETSKYINIENQTGPVDSGLDKRPDAKSWWSGLWLLKHVSGPEPPRLFKEGEVIVLSPRNGSTIKGNTKLEIHAPGLTHAVVKSWLPRGRFGMDSTVGELKVGDSGEDSIVFPAERYPHGPITIRVSGTDGKRTNNYYLMVYNEGGISWNEGVPTGPPPAAKGMKLLFVDDFNDAKLSISRDGTGITAKAPCYFECRFIAQSAPGTWPAFWIMTRDVYKGLKTPADELDVIEAYGGEGPGNPNQTGYWVASHFWNQAADGGKDKSQPGVYGPIHMTKLEGGGGASWYETAHTYGLLVGADETIYYCDDIEVARHKTARLSKTEPLFFFVNFAIGGTSGWKIDLSQYAGVVDMYVDYIRVYRGE